MTGAAGAAGDAAAGAGAGASGFSLAVSRKLSTSGSGASGSSAEAGAVPSPPGADDPSPFSVLYSRRISSSITFNFIFHLLELVPDVRQSYFRELHEQADACYFTFSELLLVVMAWG